MTDSMIERVARACRKWRLGFTSNKPCDGLDLSLARAAIEALREPTDAMQAAVRELLERRYLGGQSWDLSDPFLSEVITVAIDAALS